MAEQKEIGTFAQAAARFGRLFDVSGWQDPQELRPEHLAVIRVPIGRPLSAEAERARAAGLTVRVYDDRF